MAMDMRQAYFQRVLHPHFVLVHLAGLIFGMHMAVASGFAVFHHFRRTAVARRWAPWIVPGDERGLY